MIALSRVVALLMLVATSCTAPSGTTAPTPSGPQSGATTSPQETTDGAASDVDGWYEAAKDEGALTVYTTFDPEHIELLLERFEERYPDVDWNTDYTSLQLETIIQRIETEAQTGNQLADVVMTAEFSVHLLDQEGLLTSFEVPEADVLPASLRHPDNKWVAYELNPAGVSWNTDLTEGPITYDDLTDPQYRGQIALNPERVDLFPSLAIHKFGGEEAARDWLEAVAENEPVFHTGNNATIEIMAAGGVTVFGTSFNDIVNRAKNEGAPVDFSLDESVVKQQVQAIFEEAPHPNAARLWANWVLSTEAQEIIRDDMLSVPTRPDTPPSAPVLPEDQEDWYPTSLEVISQFPVYETMWREVLGIEF